VPASFSNLWVLFNANLVESVASGNVGEKQTESVQPWLKVGRPAKGKLQAFHHLEWRRGEVEHVSKV